MACLGAAPDLRAWPEEFSMILQSWAEQLLKAHHAPDVIGLHVMDSVAAFLAGVRTKEGEALSELYGGRADIAERIAAAASIARLSECDDIHLPSCVTPGAVVVPVALALGFSRTNDEFNRAVAAGYTAGLGLGTGIGGARALAAGVWPTLLAAPLMAAVTASCLSGHDANQLAHAMALALSGISGRLGRPTGTPSGRWFLLGEAVLKGLRASKAAGHGFRGDVTLLSKPWLAAQAGHDAVEIGVFDSSVSASICDVGFKPFPEARQGANAVVAFQNLLSKGLDPQKIRTIEVFVPAMNVALLSRPVLDDDRLSRLSNIGLQLACAALAPEMLYDLERAVRPAAPILELARRVTVAQADDVEVHLPHRWAARVVVNTHGERLEDTVISTPFDHDGPNLTQILREKWRRLLSPQDALNSVRTTTPEGRAQLWQRIEACVSMAAQERREP
jgi:2-methylcitrate dehydratase PrpD